MAHKALPLARGRATKSRLTTTPKVSLTLRFRQLRDYPVFGCGLFAFIFCGLG